MKVSDIINKVPMGMGSSSNFAGESERPVSMRDESIWTVELIANSDDVEILEGKCVFSKRVVARSHEEAIHKVGIQTRRG